MNPMESVPNNSMGEILSSAQKGSCDLCNSSLCINPEKTVICWPQKCSFILTRITHFGRPEPSTAVAKSICTLEDSSNCKSTEDPEEIDPRFEGTDAREGLDILLTEDRGDSDPRLEGTDSLETFDISPLETSPEISTVGLLIELPAPLSPRREEGINRIRSGPDMGFGSTREKT